MPGAGDDVCLVRASPATGRKHQIRVHLAAWGLPLLGDSVYGVRTELISRQALHAEEVRLRHPLDAARRLRICAPVPDDFAALVSALGIAVPSRGAGQAEFWPARDPPELAAEPLTSESREDAPRSATCRSEWLELPDLDAELLPV